MLDEFIDYDKINRELLMLANDPLRNNFSENYFEENEVIRSVTRTAEFYKNYHYGFVSYNDLLSRFSQESGIDQESLVGTDYSGIVGMRMRQLGWRESDKCDGYEFLDPTIDEEVPETLTDEQLQRLRRQHALIQMLGIEAGAHSW